MVESRWIKGNHWVNAVRFSRYSTTRRPRWFYSLIKSISVYLKDPRESRGRVKRDPHTSLRLSCPLSVKVSGSVSIRSTLCLRTFLLFSFSLLVSIPVQRSSIHERIHEPSIHCTTVLEPFFLGPFSISLAALDSIPCHSTTEVSELRPPPRFLAFFCLLTIIIRRWCNFDRPESRTYEKRSGSTKTGSLRSKVIKSPVSTLLFRYVLGFPSYGFLWDRDFCVQSILS